MKRLFAMLLAVVVLATFSIPAMAAAASIRKTEYEGNGVVEVDFKKDVQYKNAKVTVKDSSGKTYTVKIIEKDEDDLTFRVSGVAAGKSYTYTISGVRAGRSGRYDKVSGTFKTPAAKKLSIKDLDYDRGDRELEVDFSGKVQYKGLKASVQDSKGKSYSVKVLEKDNDGLELRITGLKKGTKYSLKVSGVRLKNTGSYGSLSASFTA